MRCPTCEGAQVLKLREKEFIACMDCRGTGKFIMYEERAKPLTRVFLPRGPVVRTQLVRVT